MVTVMRLLRGAIVAVCALAISGCGSSSPPATTDGAGTGGETTGSGGGAGTSTAGTAGGAGGVAGMADTGGATGQGASGGAGGHGGTAGGGVGGAFVGKVDSLSGGTKGSTLRRLGQPFWEHCSPIPTVNPEQCPPYWVHSGSPQVQSEHWPALGTGRHAHWVAPSAGFRTFTIC